MNMLLYIYITVIPSYILYPLEDTLKSRFHCTFCVLCVMEKELHITKYITVEHNSLLLSSLMLHVPALHHTHENTYLKHKYIFNKNIINLRAYKFYKLVFNFV